MSLDEAIAYLTPHRLSGSKAPIILNAEKMREAITVIENALALAGVRERMSAAALQTVHPGDLS